MFSNSNQNYNSIAVLTEDHQICVFDTTGKVIHPKYYKHLKKAAQHRHFGRSEWAGFWQNSLYFK